MLNIKSQLKLIEEMRATRQKLFDKKNKMRKYDADIYYPKLIELREKCAKIGHKPNFNNSCDYCGAYL